MPLSVASLHRRSTHGVFHILREAAQDDGRDLRHYISPFGDIFQTSVEDTFRRAVAASPTDVPITADELYGPREARRRSSDVILEYDRNPVFVEVVSGPLQAATVTRGDLRTFSADVGRLVVGKAEQLDTSINHFFDGTLKLKATDPDNVNKAWPVIVTSIAFPHAATITPFVEQMVHEAGWLRGRRVSDNEIDPSKVGQLAIVSAEDLFYCEGFMQKVGRTFLSLIRGWKSGSYADLSFKNYLIAEGGGKAPGSDYFETRFAAANAEAINRLLGTTHTAADVLSRTRDADPEE